MKRCLFSFKAILFTFLTFLAFQPLAMADTESGSSVFKATVKRNLYDLDPNYVVTFRRSNNLVPRDPMVLIQLPAELLSRGYFKVSLESLPLESHKTGCADEIKIEQGRGDNYSGYLKFILRHVDTDPSDANLLVFNANVEYSYEKVDGRNEVIFSPKNDQFARCSDDDFFVPPEEGVVEPGPADPVQPGVIDPAAPLDLDVKAGVSTDSQPSIGVMGGGCSMVANAGSTASASTLDLSLLLLLIGSGMGMVRRKKK